MKALQFIILTIALSLGAPVLETTAQSESKWHTVEFKVEGTCDMCKTRIETALDVKGVKFAEWNVDSKMVTVVFRPDKVTEAQLHQILADIGHDTDQKVATDEVYNELHGCCKYRTGGKACSPDSQQ